MIYFAIAVIVAHSCFIQWHTRKLMKDWQAERQKLLDRIQAPTFAEYAAKDLKEKKIEASKEKEDEKIQFVS